MSDFKLRIVIYGWFGTVMLLVATIVLLHQATTWRNVSATVESVHEMCSFVGEQKLWQKRRRYRTIRCSDAEAIYRLEQEGFSARGLVGYDIVLALHVTPRTTAIMFVSTTTFSTIHAVPGAKIEVQQGTIDPSRLKPTGLAWREFGWVLAAFIACLTITVVVSVSAIRKLAAANK